MNTGRMVAQVTGFAGIRGDDPVATPQVVLDALNAAQQEIADQADWPWLQQQTTLTTVAGTATYAMPTNWSSSRRIVDPDGRDLTRFSAAQLEDDWQNTSGTPSSWTVDEDMILLFPTPNDALTYVHHFNATVTDLSVDADVSVFPERHHPVLVQYALAMVMDLLGKPDRANLAQQRAQRLNVVMHRDARRSRGPLRARIREDAWL